MALNQVTPPAIVSDISTLVGFFTNNRRVDIVKILNQGTMQQLFIEARPMKATVRETSKGLRYPIETGAILTDSIIVQPTEIRMDLFIPSSGYATVYPQLRTARLNGTLLAIQTRTGIYKNMFIEEMPHDENSDMMDAIMMQIKFTEALQVGASQNGATTLLDDFSPASPASEDTINKGLIGGLAAASSSLSYFHAASVVGL